MPIPASSFVSFPWPRAGLWLGAALILSGCGAVRTIAGINTIHLQDAKVSTMESDIGPGVTTICPRQPVQMHVFVNAQLPRQPAPALYETWRGANGTRRNGMLDFRNFAFSSAQGRFDELGWFIPNPDVLATVDSGFAISTQLLHPNAQLAQSQHYAASYECIVSAGAPGGPGASGVDGPSGFSGSDGRDGYDGQDGSHGGPGGNGMPGGNGFQGPRLRMYATYASTRLYPRLIAIRVLGDIEDVLLAPPDRPLTLIAPGGNGGAGGDGGMGGSGGDGGRGNGDKDRPGHGGDGGDGGDGGYGASGGFGGNGGEIELVYDRRYPELARLLNFDVSGGRPGMGGSGGSGGSDGNGGGGASSGRDGRYGTYGGSGPQGVPGRSGHAELSAGDVSAYFRDLPGVRML